jgi:hypothetical protein
MREALRRIVVPAVAALLLAGCTTTVPGTASPGAGEPVDVVPDDFPITGVSDAPIDRVARNALADLNAFWADASPVLRIPRPASAATAPRRHRTPSPATRTSTPAAT